LAAVGTTIVLLFAYATALPNDNYRKSKATATDNENEPICDATQGRCSNEYYIEDWGDRWLGFIEVTDQGAFHDEAKMYKLLGRVGRQAKETDLIILTYVHGWQHNADTSDSDVETFRALLRDVSLKEEARSGREGSKRRKVVGIYVGWRGRSFRLPYIEYLSFWDRKAVAERVQHSLGTVLTTLHFVWKEGNQGCWPDTKPRSTRLLTIGHSFGGLIVGRTALPILVHALNEQSSLSSGLMDGLGDLVVLINPAVEAAAFKDAWGFIVEYPHRTTTAPVLVAITSKVDRATRWAFPAGRYFSTWLDDFKTPLEREDALMAVGHVERYSTHSVRASDGPIPNVDGARFAAEEKEYRSFEEKYRHNGKLDAGWVRAYSSGVIVEDVSASANVSGVEGKRLAPEASTPFWLMRADASVINGHSDFSPRLRAFVRQLFDDVVRRHDRDEKCVGVTPPTRQ
jgi:hypothetical protein